MRENKPQLEMYEWDQIWWEHTENLDAPRALYIGDSISCGTRPQLNRLAEGKLLFDHYGSSKALDNPHLQPSVLAFTAQQHRLDMILFNNGLHGWHLEDETAYAKYYEEMLLFFREQFPQVPVYLLLSTPSREAHKDARIRLRNGVVRNLAQKYGLPVIDLYRIADTLRDTFADTVHLQESGYQKLAEEILKHIL